MIMICALLTDDHIFEGLKNRGKMHKKSKNPGGATSQQELMKQSMVNKPAENQADQCIGCSDTGALVSNLSLFLGVLRSPIARRI